MVEAANRCPSCIERTLETEIGTLMNSHMTIGRRFTLTAGTILFLSMVLTVVGIVSLSGVKTDVHSLTSDSVPGLVDAAAIRAALLKLQMAYLKHIGENEPAAIEMAEQNIAKYSASLATTLKQYDGTINHEDDRRNFQQLCTQLDAVQAAWQRVLPLSRASKNVEAMKLYDAELLPHAALALQLSDTVVDWNKDAATVIMAATTKSVDATWWTVVLLGLATLVIGCGVTWYMIQALNGQMFQAISELSKGAEQIASAASQVSSSSQSLAQGSSEQAASLEETSASSEEINSMAHKNTENAFAIAKLVGDSKSEFVNTNRQLGEMMTAMDGINESSSKIAKIIKIIDEIAFQTNILALNAAVEAARAGEAGNGFAVVADEVRSLAQRSAQAAKDTAALIEHSVTKSEAGKTKLGGVVTSIQRISSEFTSLGTLVDEVSHGSKEQSIGIDQIGKALSQMEQVTQSSAASAEKTAAAAEELSAQSESMKELTERLNRMIGSTVDASVSLRTYNSGSRAKAHPPTRRAPAAVGRFVSKHPPVKSKSGTPSADSFPLEDSFSTF